MSAYSFGKIITDDSQKLREKIMHLASASGVEVKLGFHELDDQELFEESNLLQGDGVVFNVFTPGDSDIITLFNEATAAGREAIQKLIGDASLPYSWDQARDMVLPGQVYAAVLRTRLGQFVDGLFRIENTKAVGLAIFDNGIQQVIEETAAKCKSLILRSLLVAWDMGPNALFAWRSQNAQRADQ